jgi:endonuclease YncB( thermonuclease family)
MKPLTVFRRQDCIITALCGLLLLVSCGDDKPEKSRSSTDDKATQGAIRFGIVYAIVDGDTFVLSSGKSVRIDAIDTPESGEPFYDKATEYLEELILGKKVILHLVGPGFDRYGRILAEVYVDSVNVGLSMLRTGMGWLYLFPDNAYLKDKYLPALLHARKSKIGIWSLPEPVAENYYVNVKGSYRFHRPLCFHLKNVEESKLQIIKSRKEAFALGFSPCRNCDP